jgi:hypothetical protein
MNKYVVAYMSFFDNNLKQHVVSADSPVEAALQVLTTSGWDCSIIPDCSTIEELKDVCIDSDAVISVMEI